MVTNGDAHDHRGGDGAEIDHANLANKGTNTHTIDAHIASSANPHAVTVAQVGLGNVTNDPSLSEGQVITPHSLKKQLLTTMIYS